MDAWKVVLLGEKGVGKTNLAVQFTMDCFTSMYEPLTDDEPFRKQLVVDNKMCFIEVIETQGQEEYNNLRDDLLRDGQGFVLIYSISSRFTFDQLERFHQCIRRVRPENPVFVLVGNKCDKAYEREVSKEEGSALAQQLGCEFIETSAKTAQNVHRMFSNLVRSLRRPVVFAPIPKEVKKPRCVIV
ncbi:hypothetical protein GALMADRAFT_251889 [Galerina marginata CBS 339.88]|uniref:Ras protein n=1 Tax=Galerina marginata (strain CBS 339.88) TaxID=685588 RepID=A0A067STA1_GALM3|nr:hypothetical protein GALMADRAFT_251889 [Galerina marginata CBS 339.88]